MIDMFITVGDNSEPTQFKNDIEFRNQNSFIISLDSLPSLTKFVAAVRINGY